MKPTEPQLKLLRELALKTGRSFVAPRSRAAASSEIQRLLQSEKTGPAEQKREREQIERDLDGQSGGAARVRDDEITGYGSNARWAGS